MREIDLALVERRDHAVGAALDQDGFELDALAGEEALAFGDMQIERADVAHGRGNLAEAQRGLRRAAALRTTAIAASAARPAANQAFHG